MKIQIIIGSTRQNRFSEKPAKWLFDLARTRTDAEFELLDLRDYPLPFYNEPVPAMMLKGKYTNDVSPRWAAKIGQGDGFIIVTPEYNYGYPAVLKNALDSIYDEWLKKPVGFMSYGSAQGTRSVQQLRQVAIELQMVPIESTLMTPVEIFRQGFGRQDFDPAKLFEPMKPFAEKFLDQMVWWTKALKGIR